MEWWVWLLLIIVAVIILFAIWWWWTRMRSAPAAPPMRSAPAAPRMEPRVEPVAAPAPAAASMGSDKLEVIEGIGPKIASVLRDAGIGTFAALAAADTSRLEQILKDANLPLAKPSTWAAQAALAAAGQWEELKSMQNSLKGGM